MADGDSSSPTPAAAGAGAEASATGSSGGASAAPPAPSPPSTTSAAGEARPDATAPAPVAAAAPTPPATGASGAGAGAGAAVSSAATPAHDAGVAGLVHSASELPDDMRGSEFVEAELADFESEWTHGGVVTLKAALVMVTVAKTAYKRCTAKLSFPKTYPAAPLHAEVVSDTLVPQVVAKLVTVCDKKAAELVGSRQLLPVLRELRRVVHANMFLYCADEIREVRSTLKGNKDVALKLNEVSGTVRATVTRGEYKVTIAVTVPNEYPEQPPTIVASKSTYPESITRAYVVHAEQVARRCAAGYDAATAFAPTEPDAIANTNVTLEKREIHLTAGYVRDLKSDVRFLKQAKDMREFEAAKREGTRDHAHSTAERRTVRRQLKKLTRAEAEKEAKAEEEELEAMRKEMEALTRKTSDTAQPSVAPILLYLVRDFAIRLPNKEACQACGRPVLPPSASACARYVASETHSKKPMRIYCGHWYHYKCLDTFLTTPPFVKSCPAPTCGRRVYHKNWTSDTRKLERAWANEQAKKRELAEVADLMGMSD